MIYSSLAVVALSASALINPFTNLVHMHPRQAQPDTRVSIVLVNKALGVRDVQIDGHIYTVMANHSLDIKAPAGTTVYASSGSKKFQAGAAIVELKPELNHKQVIFN